MFPLLAVVVSCLLFAVCCLFCCRRYSLLLVDSLLFVYNHSKVLRAEIRAHSFRWKSSDARGSWDIRRRHSPFPSGGLRIPQKYTKFPTLSRLPNLGQHRPPPTLGPRRKLLPLSLSLRGRLSLRVRPDSFAVCSFRDHEMRCRQVVVPSCFPG